MILAVAVILLLISAVGFTVAIAAAIFQLFLYVISGVLFCAIKAVEFFGRGPAPLPKMPGGGPSSTTAIEGEWKLVSERYYRS